MQNIRCPYVLGIHCKTAYIHRYFFFWGGASFPHFNGTGTVYRFVSVIRPNNEAPVCHVDSTDIERQPS